VDLPSILSIHVPDPANAGGSAPTMSLSLCRTACKDYLNRVIHQNMYLASQVYHLSSEATLQRQAWFDD